MAGIQIPIGGDTAAFRAAIRELSAVIRQLSKDINAAFAPAAQAARQTVVATKQVTAATKESSGGFKAMAKSAFGVVAAVAGVASSLASVASAGPMILRMSRVISVGLGNAMRAISAQVSVVGTKLREVMASPAFRKIVIGAAAATVAIVGTVAAVRAARLAFRVLHGAATGTFAAISSAARAAGNAVRGSFSGLKTLVPGIGGGGGSLLGPLAGVVGAAGAVALAVSQFRTGSDIASEFERATIALTALTGSADTAAFVLQAMKATWEATGVAVSEQARTIQKFIALGFSPDDAVQLQRNILDVAGAVGLTADEAAGLGSALAQVQSKGIVSMEELRQQIAERGIPVFAALAAKLGVTQAALIDMVSAGKVPAAQLIGIFQNMEGTFARFRGGAEKLGMTFGGMIARLRGAWQLLLADFAAPINAALKPLLMQATEIIQGMRQRAVEMGQAVGNALLAAFALFRSGKTADLLATGLKIAMAGATDLLMRGLRSAVAFLAAALPPIFSAAVATLKDPRFWKGIGNMLSGVAKVFAAEMLAVLPGFGNKSKAAALRQEGLAERYVSEGQIQSSGRGVDMADVVARSLFAGIQAAAKAGGGAMSRDLESALASWRDLAASVGKEMDALRKKTALPADPAAAPSATAGVVSSLAAAAGQIMTLASSTARIGGGGFGMTLTPMVSEQKKTNGLLTKLVEQGKTKNVATYA